MTPYQCYVRSRERLRESYLLGKTEREQKYSRRISLRFERFVLRKAMKCVMILSFKSPRTMIHRAEATLYRRLETRNPTC